MREHTNIVIRQMLVEDDLEEARKRSLRARARLMRRRMTRITPFKLGAAGAGLVAAGALGAYGVHRLHKYIKGRKDDVVSDNPDAPIVDEPYEMPPIVPLSRTTNANINEQLDYYLDVKSSRGPRARAMMMLKGVIDQAGNDLLDLKDNSRKLNRMSPDKLRAFIKELNSASHFVTISGKKSILPAQNRVSFEHLSIPEIRSKVTDYFKKNKHKFVSARSSSFTYGLVNLWWAPFYQRGSIIANFYAYQPSRQIDSVILAFRSVKSPSLVLDMMKPVRSYTATDKPRRKGAEGEGTLLHKDAEPTGRGFTHFKLVPEPYIRSWLNRTITPRILLWGEGGGLDKQ